VTIENNNDSILSDNNIAALNTTVVEKDGHISSPELDVSETDSIETIVDSVCDIAVDSVADNVERTDVVGFSEQNNARHWFYATTRIGLIAVGVMPEDITALAEDVNNDVRILDAACALGREEAIIQWAEEWLDTPLDLHLGQQHLSSQAICLSISSGDNTLQHTPANVVLSLPASVVLAAGEPIVNPPNSLSLRWQTIDCRLNIARFTVAAEQVEQLHEASLVIIPNSFQSLWPCQVSAIQPGLIDSYYFSAQFNPENSCLSFSSLESPTLVPVTDEDLPEQVTNGYSSSENELVSESVRAVSHMSLELNTACAIGVDCLMNWNAQQPAIFSLARSSIDVQLLSNFQWDLNCNGNKLASGHLLPVAQGFGLFIDTVD